MEQLGRRGWGWGLTSGKDGVILGHVGSVRSAIHG